MHRILFAGLCIAAISAAHAQTLCRRVIDTVQCNDMTPQPYVNPWQQMDVQINRLTEQLRQRRALQAQANEAEAQAELAREHAALLREQREQLEAQRMQQEAETAARAREAAQAERGPRRCRE